MEALDYLEKREKSRKRVYSSISLLFSWLLPWVMSVTILILGINVLNAKSVMFSLLVLSLSLFLFRATKEERKLRIMFIFFSYLVTLSFLLTVILCWPGASSEALFWHVRPATDPLRILQTHLKGELYNDFQYKNRSLGEEKQNKSATKDEKGSWYNALLLEK
mgnify:CR=1 FL=1